MAYTIGTERNTFRTRGVQQIENPESRQSSQWLEAADPMHPPIYYYLGADGIFYWLDKRQKE